VVFHPPLIAIGIDELADAEFLRMPVELRINTAADAARPVERFPGWLRQQVGGNSVVARENLISTAHDLAIADTAKREFEVAFARHVHLSCGGGSHGCSERSSYQEAQRLAHVHSSSTWFEGAERRMVGRAHKASHSSAAD